MATSTVNSEAELLVCDSKSVIVECTNDLIV